MNINPGEFNKKIVLQQDLGSTDNISNHIENWQNFSTVYASINGLYGEAYWAAVSQGQQDTLIFKVRWSKTLDELMTNKELTHFRIAFCNNYYEIKHCDNVEFANKTIKIKAVSREY